MSNPPILKHPGRYAPLTPRQAHPPPPSPVGRATSYQAKRQVLEDLLGAWCYHADLSSSPSALRLGQLLIGAVTEHEAQRLRRAAEHHTVVNPRRIEDILFNVEDEDLVQILVDFCRVRLRRSSAPPPLSTR